MSGLALRFLLGVVSAGGWSMDGPTVLSILIDDFTVSLLALLHDDSSVALPTLEYTNRLYVIVVV